MHDSPSFEIPDLDSFWATNRTFSVPASTLVAPHPPGVDVVGEADWSTASWRFFTDAEKTSFHAPHHLETRGLPVLPVFLALWADEVKATTSTKHDKHETMAIQILNVPPHINRFTRNVGVLAAVKDVSCHQVAAAVFQDMRENLEKGIEWVIPDDAAPGGYRRVLIAVGLSCFTGDSPKICIFCSHMGVQSRFPCPFCKFDRNTMSLRELGEARTKECTLSHQLEISNNPPPQADRPLKCQGVKEEESVNPFLHVAHVDPHADSALDALHLGPLGLVKMLVEHLIGGKSHPDYVLNASLLLAAMDWSSFEDSVTAAAFIYHWASFVGRDFKTFIQIAPAFVRALGQRAPRYAVKLALFFAGFCKLMYRTTRVPLDLPAYKTELSQWGNGFFDLYESEPRLKVYMDGKIKPHYIAHADEFVDRYGFFNLYATETCEGLNKGIRGTLVIGNYKETSSTAARNFAAHMGIEYMRGGGFWLGPNGQGGFHAGEAVVEMLQDDDSVAQNHYSHSHGMVYGAVQRGSSHRRQLAHVSSVVWPNPITVADLASVVSQTGYWSLSHGEKK